MVVDVGTKRDFSSLGRTNPDWIGVAGGGDSRNW